MDLSRADLGEVTRAAVCPRCGCAVPAEGQRRHDAWHEFVESGIAELVAAMAAAEVRDDGNSRPR
jgi:hypothetical protein